MEFKVKYKRRELFTSFFCFFEKNGVHHKNKKNKRFLFTPQTTQRTSSTEQRVAGYKKTVSFSSRLLSVTTDNVPLSNSFTETL